MADQGPKKAPSIPSWQKDYQPGAKQETSPSSIQPSPKEDPTESPQSSTSDPPSLEQAQTLLEDESIRNASHERKVDFLKEKGLREEEIQKLLGPPSSSSDNTTELKTIHDSSQAPSEREQDMKESTAASPQATAQQVTATTTTTPKRDIPPIITYPEFLLKPQKPPPLVTFERLANAAYVFAGISALTWGASQYLVQPMLASLTEARHSLAETAKSDLETLNSKLESTVSHVPYIPSLAVLQKQQQQKQQQSNETADEDDDSEISDPTELFHRDIATQTSPHPSRTLSLSSSSFGDSAYPYTTSTGPTSYKDATTSQSSRLRSLHSTLASLHSSQTTHFSEDRLSQTMSDFQSTLDKLDTSYNPFQIDFTNGASSSFSSYSVADSNAAKGSGGDKNTTGSGAAKPNVTSEATKFKTEIRALKGAFLSSRNFPTARPAQPFTLPTR